MLPYLVASGLLLHLLFWGAGLAMLAMPRPWARFWPVLAPAAGTALQSLVVWAGAYANLRGTNAYAWPAELVPAALLAAGLVCRRGRAAGELARFGLVFAVMAACLFALVQPLTRAAPGLGTASLGSCDAADYAAGARVLMEFAHSDRGGFLGLTEVVRILSVGNFFDFWLRLNHFTPSALIALNGAIFHCSPAELTGLLAIVALVATLPVVFWIGRAVLGYRPGVSLGIAALFGFSPVMVYAVFQVASGQLLAAPAIALATWAGVALWRGPVSGRRGWAFFGLLAIAYALILGSYNFIVIVCLVPACGYAAGLAVPRGEWRRLGRWLWLMLLPLAFSGALFWERVAGLTERFLLFKTYDFGWRIPGLGPEGWLGMVHGPGLAAFAEPVRLVLAVLVVGAIVAALWPGDARRNRLAFLACALAVPVLAGYGYLLVRGVRLNTNASYDAYKLLAVFHPVLLPVLCVWLAPPPRRSPWGGGAAAVLAVIVVTGNFIAWRGFQSAMRSAPLVTDRDLEGVRKAETMAEVGSLNMRVPDMWSRLWANELLLRKPQYFPTHTYEGRLNTPLRGDWDLDGSLVAVSLPDGDSVRINSRYFIVRVASPYYLTAELGKGWYDEERQPRSGLRWCWNAGTADVRLDNPQRRPLRVSLRLDAESLAGGDLHVWAGGRMVGTVSIGLRRSEAVTPEFTVPPGKSRIRLRSVAEPVRASPGDSRLLAVRLYGLVVQVGADPAL